MGGTVLINDTAIHNGNNQQHNRIPVALLAQVNLPQANQEQAQDAFIGKIANAANAKKKGGFNPFSFVFGIAKGFVKEAINIALFIPKLAFSLITNPVGTIKGLVNGIIAIGSLLSNPAKLMELLKKGWEYFKEADSEKKGEIIGRILCNFVPIPGIGSPLLLNARLISTFRRFGVSAKAIACNTKTLARFYRMSGRSKWKTLLAARKIGKKANLKKDFEKALRLEGIPRELAPRLIIAKLPPQMGGGYIASKHLIIINKTHLNIFPSWYIGGFVRHEVKHAGQALHAASIGGKVPTMRPLPLSDIRKLIKAKAKEKYKNQCYSEYVKNFEINRANQIKFWKDSNKFWQREHVGNPHAQKIIIENEKRIKYLEELKPTECDFSIWMNKNNVVTFESLTSSQRRYLHRLALQESRAEIKVIIQRFRNKYNLLPEHVWDSAVKLKPKIKTNIPASEICSSFAEANKFGMKLVSFSPLSRCKRLIETIMNRKYKMTISLKTGLVSTRRKLYGGPLREAAFFAKVSLFSFIRTVKTYLKRVKKYKTCPIEAEAFRVQRLYTGLCPRFYSPSIHNLPRLVSVIEETQETEAVPENNKPNNENENGRVLNEPA